MIVAVFVGRAEGKGFEPLMTLPPYTLSRRADSTTLAPFLSLANFITKTAIILSMSLTELSKEIKKIRERNKKVEVNKAWETSKTRRLLLCIFTYLAIGFYLQTIKVSDPWVNAVVPSVGFLLSTLTLPFFRGLWEKHIYKG